MPLLDSFSPDTLTPTRLWTALDLPTRELAAKAAMDSDPETRAQAIHAISSTLNFRRAGILKLPTDKQVYYLTSRVRPDHELASSLLLALHLKYRQDLLGSFLDQLRIPHDNGLVATEYNLQPMDTSTLKPAVHSLREQFDEIEVEVNLATLVALDPDTWGALTHIILPGS